MNRNYLYNVGYYEGLVTRATEYKQKNNDMLLATYRQSDEEIALTEQSFVLETVYPGLLVGVGYPHMAGGNGEDKAEEIKVGFSLDYVNGLPYIPGSGTKGFLRSVFRRYPEYIMQTLGIDDMEIVKALETELFETGSDVFLDVYPVRPGADGKLLAADYITSHLTEKEEMDGLVEPVPIKMMKILPGVQLLFRFLLKDSVLAAEDYRCLKDDVFMSKEVKIGFNKV